MPRNDQDLSKLSKRELEIELELQRRARENGGDVDTSNQNAQASERNDDHHDSQRDDHKNQGVASRVKNIGSRATKNVRKSFWYERGSIFWGIRESYLFCKQMLGTVNEYFMKVSSTVDESRQRNDEQDANDESSTNETRRVNR